jgi:hypothetical protein
LDGRTRPTLRLTRPPIQSEASDLSPGVKRTRRETDKSPPSSADVKKGWSYTCTPPIRLLGVTLTGKDVEAYDCMGYWRHNHSYGYLAYQAYQYSCDCNCYQRNRGSASAHTSSCIKLCIYLLPPTSYTFCQCHPVTVLNQLILLGKEQAYKL